MSSPSEPEEVWIPSSTLRDAMRALAELNAAMQSSWFAEAGDDVVKAILYFMDAHRRILESIVAQVPTLIPDADDEEVVQTRRTAVLLYENRFFGDLMEQLALSMPDLFFDGKFPIGEWAGIRPTEEK